MGSFEEALLTMDKYLTRDTTENNLSVFRPWSFGDLMQRIRSFHWSWADRQSPIDVITCASYGWCQEKYQEPNEISNNWTIICTFCKAQLILPFSNDLVKEAKTALSQEYYLLISQTGHLMHGLCPWVLSPAKNIHHSRFTGTKREFENILVEAKKFPPLNFNISTSIEIPMYSLDQNLNYKSFALALCQWRLRQTDSNLIICRFECSQHQLPSTPTDHSDIRIDPVKLHAWFCPLLNQNGIEHFIRSIKNYLESLGSKKIVDIDLLTPCISFGTRQLIKEVFERDMNQ